MTSTFVIFGVDHLAALALVAVTSGLAFRAGQSRLAPSVNTVGGIAFSLFAVALWLFRIRDGFQAAYDLPLWICDMAFLICMACFIRPTDVLLTLVAYWGLAGTLQALITPDLLHGFPSKQYLLFFIGHALIVVCVFFLIGKNRPPRLAGPHGVGVAWAGLLIYTVLVGSLDAVFGWNYGYLRSKPLGWSVLEEMGPWPIYILAALALALVLFIVVAGLLRLLWNVFPGDSKEP